MSPQAVLARVKPRRIRSRTACTSQTKNGNGTRVTRASRGLIQISTAAVSSTNSTFDEKSIRCIERKLLIRSVSLPTRVIRSPVRRAAKKSSDSPCMWA